VVVRGQGPRQTKAPGRATAASRRMCGAKQAKKVFLGMEWQRRRSRKTKRWRAPTRKLGEQRTFSEGYAERSGESRHAEVRDTRKTEPGVRSERSGKRPDGDRGGQRKDDRVGNGVREG
jgi:hypothetical protein